MHAYLLRYLLPFAKPEKRMRTAMHELKPPDTHHFNAAMGWFELGNQTEAIAELARISVANRSHPDVLELTWRILAAERKWAEALEVSRELIRMDPENPSGWVHQSYSLHELKRTTEALTVLVPVVEKFPGFSTIPYNLACYACQLGDLKQARRWLAKAIEIQDKE